MSNCDILSLLKDLNKSNIKKFLFYLFSYLSVACFCLPDKDMPIGLKNFLSSTPPLSALDLFTDANGFFWGCVCYALSILIIVFFPSYDSKKQIIKEYLDQLHIQFFDHDLVSTRITIFRVYRGISLWPRFLFQNILCLKKHLEKKTFRYQIKSFPWIQ